VNLITIMTVTMMIIKTVIMMIINTETIMVKKHNYVKVLVDDPFYNRDIILKVTKKQKGILYVFLVADLIFLSDGLINFSSSISDAYTVLSATALITYADALSERNVII